MKAGKIWGTTELLLKTPFIEIHQDPDNAPSDGPCMTKLSDMEELLKRLMAIDHVTKTYT